MAHEKWRRTETQVPSFPTHSLFSGSIPVFPTYSITIGIPFSSISYTFSVPDPALIPQWIGELFLYFVEYLMGWAGAIFLFGIKFLTAEFYNGFSWLTNFLLGKLNSLISIGETVAKGTGVLSPFVTASILGIIMLAFIGAVFGLGKLLTKIIGG